MSEQIKAKSYTLRENGSWLAQVILTTDGGFFCISDYGNFNFAWRSYGQGDFREFLLRLDKHYFAGKMVNGMAYIAFSKKIDQAAMRFTEHILPVLQQVLKEELENKQEAQP